MALVFTSDSRSVIIGNCNLQAVQAAGRNKQALTAGARRHAGRRKSRLFCPSPLALLGKARLAVRRNGKGGPTLIGRAASFSAFLPLCLEDSRAPPKAISAPNSTLLTAVSSSNCFSLARIIQTFSLAACSYLHAIEELSNPTTPPNCSSSPHHQHHSLVRHWEG